MKHRHNRPPLFEAFRSLLVNVAADVFSTVEQMKRSAERASEPGENGEEPLLRSVRAPSPTRVSEFLGDVAHLGLDQINGVLEIKTKYWDDVTKWSTDVVLPKRPAKRVPPELKAITAHVGESETVTLLVTNPLSHKAKVTVKMQPLRTSKGAAAEAIEVNIDPDTIDLDPGQSWPCAATLTFVPAGRPEGKHIDPGHYVAQIDARIGERGIASVLLDIHLTRPDGHAK